MDENFTAINRRALARAIKLHLAMRAREVLELTESSTFETDFFNDPGDPTVDKLTAFKTFYDEVVVRGWTFLKQEADTPAEIEQVYAYLSAQGVSFGPQS